ncbi:MAG: hypothetical protein ACOZAA_16095 [Pseudomonadota bacterium]
MSLIRPFQCALTYREEKNPAIMLTPPVMPAAKVDNTKNFIHGVFALMAERTVCKLTGSFARSKSIIVSAMKAVAAITQNPTNTIMAVVRPDLIACMCFGSPIKRAPDEQLRGPRTKVFSASVGIQNKIVLHHLHELGFDEQASFGA